MRPQNPMNEPPPFVHITPEQAARLPLDGKIPCDLVNTGTGEILIPCNRRITDTLRYRVELCPHAGYRYPLSWEQIIELGVEAVPTRQRAAKVAPPPYTVEAPTKPGWYWYKENRNAAATVVRVSPGGRVRSGARTSRPTYHRVEHLRGFWFGPLQEP